jgi:hypothetical protein
MFNSILDQGDRRRAIEIQWQNLQDSASQAVRLEAN